MLWQLPSNHASRRRHSPHSNKHIQSLSWPIKAQTGLLGIWTRKTRLWCAAKLSSQLTTHPTHLSLSSCLPLLFINYEWVATMSYIFGDLTDQQSQLYKLAFTLSLWPTYYTYHAFILCKFSICVSMQRRVFKTFDTARTIYFNFLVCFLSHIQSSDGNSSYWHMYKHC